MILRSRTFHILVGTLLAGALLTESVFQDVIYCLFSLYRRLVLDIIGHAGFSLNFNIFEEEHNEFVEQTKAVLCLTHFNPLKVAFRGINWAISYPISSIRPSGGGRAIFQPPS